MARPQEPFELTPELLLRAYSIGIFPMSESADDPEIFWVEPELRGIIPLDSFHVPKRLQRTVRSDIFEVSADRDFTAVIDGCAEPGPGREKTWINPTIRSLYTRLFHMGHAHTVECRVDGELVGGLYGVSLGRAFFGARTCSRRTDASKVALVHLVARLKAGGFTLLDTQFTTAHLARFGTIEVSRRAYKRMLAHAVEGEADYGRLGSVTSGELALQSTSQTS